MSRISVLVIGATGKAGGSLVDGLLPEPDFHVVAAIRSSSLQKPAVADLKSRGVEIREIDIGTATEEQLVALLKDIDIVLSAIVHFDLHLQYPLIDAAKKAGVKRFIPCDWAPACKRGVRKLHDEKLDIHDYIYKVGIGYTFIDCAMWFLLPIVGSGKPGVYKTGLAPILEELPKHITGTGNVKNALIDLQDMGRFVPHILRDPRTLNRYIFLWSEEVTQNEIIDIAKRISGKEITPIHVSEEEVLANMKANMKATQGVEYTVWEYSLSMYIRGDNTIENAKKVEFGGALDAKELYPDLKLCSLEEHAREFYREQ